MSKRETPMVRHFWHSVGGILIEEFSAVKRSMTNGPRFIDAIIIPSMPTKIARSSEVNIEGQDILVVQAKTGRLGMYLMGQTLFSAELMKKFKPNSIRAIALCNKDDSVLRPLLERYAGMEVVIIPKELIDSLHDDVMPD
jgi:hypothetical protein